MGTELTNYDEAWAASAKQAMIDVPAPQATFISTQGGILALNKEPMPGNQLAAIILDSVFENVLYPNDQAYDSENPSTPTCYAYGRGADLPTMGPHISMANRLDYFKPEHDTCNGCLLNEWGSGPKGRGKACKNKVRLSMIPAGQYKPRPSSRDFDLYLEEDVSKFASFDEVFLRLPVTSVAAYKTYVSQVAAIHNRAPYGVVTRIGVEPDPKSQFKVTFTLLELVPSELYPTLHARHLTAESQPERGYDPPDVQAAQRQSGALAGLRRPGA